MLKIVTKRWSPGLIAPLAAMAIAAVGCAGEADTGSEYTSSEEGAALTDGQIVKITSVNSGMVLDVEGVSQDNGARTHQWTDLGTANQQWRLRHTDGDRYELISVNSGKCLDVGGVSKDDGAPIIQWDCWGGDNQKYRFRQVSGDEFEIEASHSGKCLDVTGVSKDLGAYVQQWGCGSGAANQRWRVQPIGSGGGGGTTRPERFATILYGVWADHFRGSRDGNGRPFYMPNGAPYATNGAYHWWGTPAFGNGIDDYHFMNDNDPDQPNRPLIDYHADLLHDGGIDFITLDLSNGEHDLIVKAARAVAKRYSERPRDRTPQIALFVRGTDSVQFIKDTFYSGQYDDGIWFKYEGKPLILIANADRPVPTGGAIDAFTARHMWGLQDTSDKWSFKLNTEPGRPGTAFYLNGQPEEMSVCAATQATYMTSPEGRKGRQDGRYFEEQWGYVMEKMPKFVFLTAWNEWGSQNFGDANNPVFTDTFGTEFSADLEPMKDGHGDRYYQLMKQHISEFKSR